ncbi:MAG: PAS domain S-box protein [Chloroflexi bacterium]|nr:PAS domain S-box protein [Chloroflexota bacterium]
MLGSDLLRSDLWLRDLWEHAPDAMALSDAAGTVLAANRAYYELYGYAPDEVIGSNFALIFPVERQGTARAQYEATFRGEEAPPPVRAVVRSKSGLERVVEVRVVFVEEHGEREAMLSIIRDVTDEVTARQQAARTQSDLRTLLLSLSHDIKNPLAIIKGHAQVVRRQIVRHGVSARPERVVDSLLHIESNALRVAELVDELVEVATLDQAASPSLHLSRIDLTLLIRDAVDRHQRLADLHQFAVDAPPESLQGVWDERRLVRVLDNLLGNAIKYSPGGGLITIRIAAEERACGKSDPHSGWKSSAQAGVLVSVEDNGIGITADDLPRVFDRFHRGANVPEATVGSGIGLTSVAQIVHQHGGTVDIASRVGQGTQVSVWLPLYPLESV